MKKIFIGIPTTRDNFDFRESFSLFFREAKDRYEIESFKIGGLGRDEAREVIVSKFLLSDKDYLLFLDDDHTEHEVDMLDVLVESNVPVCAIKCYSRWFPYQCTCMIVGSKNNNYFEESKTKGIHECYFVGFGMTLIKREVFDILDKPYFQCNENGEREDNYFCEKLIKNRIPPYGCFDYTLPHNGIDESNVMDLRKTNIGKYVAKQQKIKVINNILAKKKDLTQDERDFLINEKEKIDKTVI